MPGHLSLSLGGSWSSCSRKPLVPGLGKTAAPKCDMGAMMGLSLFPLPGSAPRPRSLPHCLGSQLLPPRAPSHPARGSGGCETLGTGGFGQARGGGAGSPRLSPPAEPPSSPRFCWSLWGRHRERGPAKQGAESAAADHGSAEGRTVYLHGDTDVLWGPGPHHPFQQTPGDAAVESLSHGLQEGGDGCRRGWMDSESP